MMNKLKAVVAMLLLALPLTQSLAQVAGQVKVETITVHGKNLEGNLEGDSPDRQVLVYLPPGYATQSNKRYPVIYLLHGYGGPAETWNSFHKLAERMDAAFKAGSKELIIVAPDAMTIHKGSFYSNSVTVGNWESYLADELVKYIDKNYRTIANRNARAIAGFSMGGYGTWRMAMKRPDTYGVAYSMSACCMDPLGDGNSRLGVLETVKTKEDADKLNLDRVALAFAAAWAPNPQKPPFFYDIPVVNGVKQPDVQAELAANAGNIMLHQYIPAIKSLNAIGMEIGLQDALHPSNLRMHELLDLYGIKHQWETYEGGHGDKLGERMEKHMLPFMSAHLEFGKP
ncbi:MAG TPA: alpha/beta hydrolase-fold protein [Candidatus Acidoferrum sp.]|nr:alpha/beta hydrolase-fold protein [Candidatus Acidoferrum sp.]